MRIIPLLIATVALPAIPSALRAQDELPEASAHIRCLEAGSAETTMLIGSVTLIGTRDSRGYAEFRQRALGGRRVNPDSISVVTDQALCAKAHQLISDRLAESAVARSNSISLVRVAGHYVARYRHYAPGIDRELPRTCYLDPQLTRVLAAMVAS